MMVRNCTISLVHNAFLIPLQPNGFAIMGDIAQKPPPPLKYYCATGCPYCSASCPMLGAPSYLSCSTWGPHGVRPRHWSVHSQVDGELVEWRHWFLVCLRYLFLLFSFASSRSRLHGFLGWRWTRSRYIKRMLGSNHGYQTDPFCLGTF
jgi:hypothetical protein